MNRKGEKREGGKGRRKGWKKRQKEGRNVRKMNVWALRKSKTN